MSVIDNLKKYELKLVVEELGLTAPESSKIIDLTLCGAGQIHCLSIEIND